MKTVKIWDPFVRIFHWSLVIAVMAQLMTGEDLTNIHIKIGYFIIVLLLARIIWGFIGSKYARFADFIYSPKEIWAYLTGLFKKNPKHYIGHNPAGGAMVITLLFFLLLTTLAGLKTYGAMGKGPLAYVSPHIVSNVYADEERHEENDFQKDFKHSESKGTRSFWKEIHESLVGVIITLVVLHILGVIISSYIHKENLIWAMVSGQKKVDDN
jgi:cytochrome b